MAKPDWGELQKRFLSDHAATGISPKEWCEAHNLNYVTARRYIKKTAAQNTKIYPRKIVRTAQKDKSAEELVDMGTRKAHAICCGAGLMLEANSGKGE